MRILLFTNLYPTSLTPNHGSFIQERIERLARRMDFEYRVIHPVPLYPPLPGKSRAAMHSRLPAEETVDGIEVYYPRYVHVPRLGVPKQARRMVRGARDLFRRVVAEFGPALVDAHYVYPDGCAAIRLACESGLPCLVTARGSDVNSIARESGVAVQLRELLPSATRLLAVSRDLAASTAELAGVATERVIVAPNGVDLERFRPGADAPLRRLVTLGRLVPGKRVDLLIRALRERAELPALVILGDGPERSALVSLARECGVADRVQFRGELSRDDVASEMALGGLFAFPTSFEGCPNALLEALACGLPAICTGVSGIPDLLGDADAGMLLPREAGPGAWARVLSDALARFDREADRWSANARRRAEQHAWDPTLALLSNLFEQTAPRVDSTP